MSSRSENYHKPYDRKALFFMIVGLGCGLGIAPIQHLMNSKLHGREVAIIDAYLRRAWISSINTLLAFLVKVSFVSALGIAIVQRQWFNIHRDVYTIKELDAITNIQGDLTSFMDRVIWSRCPSLALLAIISWILPVAVIVVPGTLTVATVSVTRQELAVVPQLDYSSGSWIGNNSQRSYQEFIASRFHPVATSTVYRTMYASASSGKILALQSKYANTSYHLDFFAPRLRCTPATKILTNDLTQTWGQIYDQGTWSIEIGIIDFAAFALEDITDYLWTNETSSDFIPSDSSRNGSLIVHQNSDGSRSTDQIFNQYLDYSNDAAHLYFMSNGGKWSGSSMLPTVEGPVDWAIGGRALVNTTDCKLYNSSYSVDFNFSYPTQNIKVVTVDKNVVSFGNVSSLYNYTEEAVGDSYGPTIYTYVFDPITNAYASIVSAASNSDHHQFMRSKASVQFNSGHCTQDTQITTLYNQGSSSSM